MEEEPVSKSHAPIFERTLVDLMSKDGSFVIVQTAVADLGEEEEEQEVNLDVEQSRETSVEDGAAEKEDYLNDVTGVKK